MEIGVCQGVWISFLWEWWGFARCMTKFNSVWKLTSYPGFVAQKGSEQFYPPRIHVIIVIIRRFMPVLCLFFVQKYQKRPLAADRFFVQYF